MFGGDRYAAHFEQVCKRLETLGFNNDALRTCDGTEGWLERALVNATVVSAGGCQRSPSFARFIDRFACRRVELLCEASHGTTESCRARAAITRRPVEHYGYRIVEAKADRQDAARMDRRICRRPNAASARASFQRFPLWTRRNWEAAALIGFGIPAGAVATTDDWDKPIVIKQARPSHAQFYEQLFHY